jgi:hypothetical protein
MQNAQYFRDQAERCLQIARQIGDGKAGQNLRGLAAHYHERAREIEEDSPTNAVMDPSPQLGSLASGDRLQD